jgi:hypothetical protein
LPREAGPASHENHGRRHVLVRAMVSDDVRQSKVVEAELANADVVALTLSALGELVWVLSQDETARLLS